MAKKPKNNKKFLALIKKYKLDRCTAPITRGAYFRFAKAIAKAHTTFGWKFKSYTNEVDQNSKFRITIPLSSGSGKRTVYHDLDFIDTGEGLSLIHI